MSKADISIEESGPFVENTSSDGAQQSATVNYGFLGGFRFFFNEHSGVELTYTHNIQTYSLDSGSIGVKNNSDEVLAAYAFRFPAKRWSPFVLAGAGALIFDPKTVAGASTQTRLGIRTATAPTSTSGIESFLERRIGESSTTQIFDMGGLNSLDWITNRVKPAVVFGFNF